ncbi:MAG: HD-GYP domain-containing protein [Cyanobacteria bacterium NC_groundwater_1444_Ag_S-0.65um_54_12]|nr:HD-GYP domain-containing protein [Cyanobacteria bacterium NC_groundwater_1444_Ag_S-0.65um_54_12]
MAIVVDKRTPLERLIPGMVLSEPIFHPMSMQMIWNSGTTLTDKHIALLRKMNLGGVRVMDFHPAGMPEEKKGPAITELGAGVNAKSGNSSMARQLPKPEQAWGETTSAVVDTSRATVAQSRILPAQPTYRRSINPQPETVNAAVPSWQQLPAPLRSPQRIKEEVLQRNVNIIRHITEQVRHASRIDINQVDQAVQATILRIVKERELIESLIDLRVYDAYTYAHSANVMSLALLVGTALNFPLERLRVLGIGALLHDVGKTLIPEDILNKPTKLTEEEFRIMATHPANGTMILSSYSWAISDIRNCAFQHHEKYNGLGYPMGLKSSQISELAQVVAVADFYDALISDRCYKKGLPPSVVYQAILNGSNVHFAGHIVQAFRKFIVPYPVNSSVELSNGQVGRVLRVNRKNLLAPVVWVEGTGEIDLAKKSQLVITNHQRVASQTPARIIPPAT